MSRAAFTYKTKDELRRMDVAEINQYVGVLRQRASWLRGPGREAVQKHIEVALKLRELAGTEGNRDA